MMTSFCFTPWASLITVITISDSLDNCKGLFNHTFFNHGYGNLIFNSGPYLITICKWESRSSTFRPGAENQSSFVIQCICSLYIRNIIHAFLEIIFINRLQSFLYMFLWKHISKSCCLSHELAKELICEAANTILIAICIYVFKLLNIIFAVKQLLIN